MKKIFLSTTIKTKEHLLTIKRIFSIKPSHCALYTRLQAETLFDKKYPKANAWDLLYLCQVEKFFQKQLIPGDIILCHNPKSPFNGKLDMKNKEINNTHTALYLGLDEHTNDMIFIHQYISEQEIITYEELLQRQLYPQYILKIEE